METIKDENQLDSLLSEPGSDIIDLFARLEGDIALLGVAGKVGLTLGTLAAKARDAAGSKQTIYGVARFSDESMFEKAGRSGMEPVRADLLNRDSIAGLPSAKNVIYLAGRKFGTEGAASATWASNVLMPANVCEHFSGSTIVAFSTGCVYPMVKAESGGCTEDTPPAPVGEYAQSCLGRERVFEYYSGRNGTRICLYRLNYAVDLRYGVLFDIADRVWKDEPVDLSADHFNIIWQRDASRYALLALEYAASPPTVINVTGPEMLSTRNVAEQMARIMKKQARFSGRSAKGCYLSNAGLCHRMFGKPGVEAERLIEWQAEWVMKGGRSLGKPTHFEVCDGEY